MSIGDKASMASAEIMTAIGLELLTEPQLLSTAKDELSKRLNGRTYQAVLNIDLTKSSNVGSQDCKASGEEFVSGIDGQNANL